jgi:hypothetical protein
MSSSTPRIITIALATLALAAPAATAMPLTEHGETQPAPRQDLRNPDQQAPAPAVPKQDLRNPDQQAPAPALPKQDLRNPDNQAPRIENVPAQQPHTFAPVERTKPVPAVVHDDSNPSPLVFILPSLVLIAMLAAATAYAKSLRPARRSVA